MTDKPPAGPGEFEKALHAPFSYENLRTAHQREVDAARREGREEGIQSLSGVLQEGMFDTVDSGPVHPEVLKFIKEVERRIRESAAGGKEKA